MTSTVLVAEQPVAVLTVECDRAPSALTATEQVATIVTVAEQGPAGRPGDGAPYRHFQTDPSALWTVPHNLGHRPFVTVLSVGGVVQIAGIVHLSDNTLQVVLDDPFPGEAICL